MCFGGGLGAEESLILPMPALVEAYAVLTRLPAPHRLSPADALQLLQASLHEVSDLVGLAEQDAWLFITGLAGQQIAGRATNDCQIIACAVRAGADRILSLNERDFERLKPAGVRIINPLSRN